MMRGFFRVEKPGPLWAIWLWSCFILKGGKKAYTTGSCCLIQTYCLAWGCKFMECNLRLLWKKRNEQLVGSSILFQQEFRMPKRKKTVSALPKVSLLFPPFLLPRLGEGFPYEFSDRLSRRILGLEEVNHIDIDLDDPPPKRSPENPARCTPQDPPMVGGAVGWFFGLVFLAFFCWAPQKSQIIRYRKWMEMVVEHHHFFSQLKKLIVWGLGGSHHLYIQNPCEERSRLRRQVHHLWSTLCSSVGVWWIYWPATLVGFEAVGHQNFLNGVYTACRTC